MTISSLQNRKSRYVHGGLTEVGQNGIEWWARFNLPTDMSDISYTVNKNTEHRLDLIANYFLGNPQLWWLLAQYNNILDPYVEIIEGRVLLIPSKDRVDLFLTQKSGGIPTTRGSDSILPPIVL